MMAEFQDVMRQWKRRFETEKILVDSETNGLDALWLAMDNPEEIESLVMSWAADHPEPVYPTWAEWLDELGLVINGTNGVMMRPETLNPIPVDIAQKLGIKPKAGGDT